MSNLDIYKGIFSDVFGVSADALGDSFTKENIDQWDSVHQLSLVSLAEDKFDIMLDPEDILGFTSYAAGLEIIRNQGVEI